MALAKITSVPDAMQPAASGVHLGTNSEASKSRWTRFLDPVIFGLFLIFAMMLPHSIKGAERAWKIAFILWLLKLAIERLRPFTQPLVAPLLAYVTLSAVSTILSPDPYLSWDRMKLVCLVMVGVVFAQNLKRLSQVRWLVIVLILSGFGAAVYTGWQYSYGVGVRLAEFPAGSRLASAGFQPDDIVTSFNGYTVHTPEQLIRGVERTPSTARVTVRYLRGLGLDSGATTATPRDFALSGLGTASMKLDRGKPIRAKGTLGHRVVFAEMLMQLGCLAWSMLLSGQRGRRGIRVLTGVIFLSVTAALVATETRAALVGLAFGCFIALFILAGKRTRVWVAAVLAVLMICAGLWIHHSRGVNWTSTNDIGTQFRILIWKDGLRLVRQHPWFGVGMETVRIHWLEWNIRGFIQFHVIGNFHSTPLQIAVERGLTTLAAWLWFVVAYIAFLVRLISKTGARSRFATTVVTAVLAGFVGFLTTSLVHYNLGEEPLVMALFFFFGLAVAIDHMLLTPGAIDVE
jgi:O-antigen ligase